MKRLMTFFLVFCLAGIGLAQIVTDDGSIITANNQPFTPSTMTRGSLTTLFASDNGFAGNMFDISPDVDLQITAIDLNLTGTATTANIDVYYRVGSSVGYENIPSAWTLFSSGTGSVAGQDLPTYIDLSGNGVTFSSGQIYGIYVHVSNYDSGVTLRYTSSGPTTYSNSELSLVTNCGLGYPAFDNYFYPREWNGTIYYDTLSSGSLTTLFDWEGGGQGNMFDITPAVDLKITALDIHTTPPGVLDKIQVYYRLGTSFGHEESPDGWFHLSCGSGISCGENQPTYIDLSNDVVFAAGQIYGIYVDMSHEYAQGVWYTLGAPTTFSNSDLSLLTNCGMTGDTAFDIYSPNCIWNGAVYYDTNVQSGTPTLTVSPLSERKIGTFTFSYGIPNDSVYLAYSTTGMGSTSVPFLNVILDLIKPKQAKPTMQTDNTGGAVWSIVIPAGTSGVYVWFQAAQYSLTTNVPSSSILYRY